MQDFNQPPPGQTGPMSSSEFLSRVESIRSDIRKLANETARVEQLHATSLASSSTGGAAATQLNRQIEDATAVVQDRSRAIRDALRQLAADLAKTSAAAARDMKQGHIKALRSEVERELQAFSAQEAQYRDRYRQQIARQYRIVNPDASEEEVRQASTADWGNEGVFQTAVS